MKKRDGINEKGNVLRIILKKSRTHKKKRMNEKLFQQKVIRINVNQSKCFHTLEFIQDLLCNILSLRVKTIKTNFMSTQTQTRTYVNHPNSGNNSLSPKRYLKRYTNAYEPK